MRTGCYQGGNGESEVTEWEWQVRQVGSSRWAEGGRLRISTNAKERDRSRVKAMVSWAAADSVDATPRVSLSGLDLPQLSLP